MPVYCGYVAHGLSLHKFRSGIDANSVDLKNSLSSFPIKGEALYLSTASLILYHHNIYQKSDSMGLNRTPFLLRRQGLSKKDHI
jgi:hypothetical protein